MALPMLHLAVAYETARLRKDITANGSYYLGSISPDAVHMRQKYEYQHKAASHFTLEKSRETDPESWIADTLTSYANSCQDSFSIGYTIHVLTDVLWTKGEGGKIFDAYDQDPTPVQKRMEAYYNDTDMIDLLLFRTEPWRKQVFLELEHAPAAAFGELVTADECDAWRIRTVHWYEQRDLSAYQPLRYTTLEKMQAFIREAAGEIAKMI